MLFHTMVGSNDIERSKRFYDTVLGTLGAGEGTRNIADSGHTRLIYNNGNGTNFIVSQPINDEPASVANGSTVAFSCDSPEQVKQLHDTAVAAGGTSIEAPPGPRETASMAPSNWPIFVIPTVTNCAEFIFLPDLVGTSPLLTLADLDHAVPRMSAFHQTSAFRAENKLDFA